MALMFLSAHPSPGEARLVANVLQTEGLHAEVRHEALVPLRGELPLGETWVEVWVPDVQLAQAREVLARVEADAAFAATSRPCPRCREENPGNFELCWACGVDLPPLQRLRLVAG